METIEMTCHSDPVGRLDTLTEVKDWITSRHSLLSAGEKRTEYC